MAWQANSQVSRKANGCTARVEDAASVYRCTMSRQSGNEWPGQEGGCGKCVQVHCEQTVREGVVKAGRRSGARDSELGFRV